MRKIIALFSFLTLLSTVALFAQNIVPGSLQKDFSYGIFTNELDAAANVLEQSSGPGFSALEHNYIFGGLANINQASNNQTASSPIWLGYYSAGSLPWSLFGGLEHTSTTADKTYQIQYSNQQIVPVVSGTTTTNYTYYETVTETNYDKRLFASLNDTIQFLIGLGNINTGLVFTTNVTNSSLPANNYTETETHNFNSAAAGDPVTVSANYTKSTTAKLANLIDMFSANIPFFMKTGSLKNYADLSASYTWKDKSSSTDTAYTVPQDPADINTNFTNTKTTITDKTSDIDANLVYKLGLPGLIGSNPKNELFVGLSGGATFHTAEYATTTFSQTFSFTPGSGATGTNTTINNDSTTDTLSGAIDYNIGLNTSHSFYFDLGNMAEFGLKPVLDISYDHSQTTPYNLMSRTVVDRQDNDNNGNFTSAGDQTITTDTTYINMVEGGGSLVIDHTITTEADLPVALKVKPKGWFVSFTLGSEPQIIVENIIEQTTTSTSSSTVTTADNTGTTTSTVVTNAGTGSTTYTLTTNWTFRILHNFGMHFDITDNISLDIDLDSTAIGTPFEFNNMNVQATIALP